MPKPRELTSKQIAKLDAHYIPIEIGKWYVLREGKPGETLGNASRNKFPVKVTGPFGDDGYWWVEDSNGQRVFMKGSDLART